MTLSAIALGANQYETTVEDVRTLISAALPGTGAIAPGQFTVTPVDSETELSVRVGPGRAVIEGTAASNQGSYFVYSPEAEVLSWPFPDGQPRIDTLVLTVADGQYGDVEDQGPSWLIVEGVASTTPSPPSEDIVNHLAPAGAWMRVADVRINPSDTVIDPANITPILAPRDGGWKPLELPSGIVTYKGRTPSYRVSEGRVWLSGAITTASGGDFSSDHTWGDAMLARVPEEIAPPRISYGALQSLARRSRNNFVGGGLLRGEVQPDGEIYAYRFTWDYTTYWIGFDGFYWWLDR